MQYTATPKLVSRVEKFLRQPLLNIGEAEEVAIFGLIHSSQKPTSMSLRYPVGKFELPTPEEATSRRLEYVKSIGDLPDKLAPLIEELEQRALLDATYRPDGWTARQVIHHLVDSHTNAYVRHKRVLTEDHPTITPYDEARWAELTDVHIVPVQVSLDILRGLHLRWATLLATCTDAQWERTGLHSGSGWTYRLDTLAAHYDWHGRHHIGHLEIILGK